MNKWNGGFFHFVWFSFDFPPRATDRILLIFNNAWLQARSRPRGRARRIVPPAILREEYFTARFIARLRPLINRHEMQRWREEKLRGEEQAAAAAGWEGFEEGGQR